MKKINLNFNGENIGFHFGLGFLGDLLERLDCSIDELMKGIQTNPFKYIPTLMQGAYAYNLIRENKEVKMGVFEFTDFIDDNGGLTSESVQLFLEAFTKSMTKDVPKEEPKLKTVGKPKANQKK